ncbi:M16 family metallopeptidase [Desulfospira joergensenii]|uniref:M16 family metallopeptidase n=1 Tax=Desulfospira joergensenii TaxID=53329 RepID=UPI0003B32B06|nr:M16 family metallopeptidase [Desulfospira joergensenii]
MKFKSLAILILLTGFVLGGCGPKHPLSFSDPSSGTKSDPALVQGVLGNGFQYVLMANQTPKDRVSLHLNVFAGSVHESDQEQGLAHYLEHMLFNGSEHFKPGDLVEYFQSIGMDFGGDANASTSYFKTVYDLNLPKGDKAYLDDGLLVLQDYARGALLLEEEIERERGIILAEKRERDSVSYQRFKHELAFELPGAIFNRRHPIGVDSVIKGADRKLLKNFYDRWYRPDNMVLVAVGDFDIKEMVSLISARFSKLRPRTGEPVQKTPRISWKPHQGIKAFYYHEPEAGETEVTIERITRAKFAPQTLENMKEQLVLTVADQIIQNRLSRLIREQTAAFSSASAYSGQFLHNVTITALNASCRPENWKTSLHQLEKMLRQACDFGFSQRELDRVKADYISFLKARVLQEDTRKTEDLSRAILEAINNKKLFLSPSQKLNLLEPFLESLSLDQVNQSFKNAWVQDHRLVLVSGNLKINPSGDVKPEEIISQTYVDATLEPVSPFEKSESKSFPYLEIPGPDSVGSQDTDSSNFQIVKRKDDVKGLGITTIDLRNNVRINLKQTGFQKNRILFKLVFGPGRRSQPAAKPGLDWIGQTTVQQSGFGAMDMDQLEEALAGRNADFEFGIEDEYFSLTGSADPKESELVFQLLYTFLKDPGFRPQGLDLAKTLYRQMYNNLKNTPDGIMRIKGSRFLAGNDTGFGLDPPDKIDQLTMEDVRDWLLPYIQSSPVELSVVGDFDMDLVIDQAAACLGSLGERRQVSFVKNRSIVFPKGKELNIALETRIEKGMVRIAFPTDDFWNIRQTRRLSMLARVFSERLRKKVREDLGASYSPYVYNHPSMIHKGYGVMHVVAAVDPASSDRILAVVKKIARQLNETGVDSRELDLVKKPVMIHLKDLRETNSYWLNSVMADSLSHPERFEWARQIISDYGSISADELSSLAKRFLNIKDAARILIGPEKNDSADAGSGE